MRQLVAGLGDAYCEELERTRIGPLRLEDADPERPVALGDALAFLPARELDDAEAERAAHGVPLRGHARDDARRSRAPRARERAAWRWPSRARARCAPS